ncbi:nucleotide exchange factor GrpE [Aliikangiella marina]|uniref:Protein GrpE n=1 Tax=Aliikangiella marina TaxID=1712262 RepID=A0A545T103_9GAMM|nr:nucleotide exchange factor GrpE [Aliikangiella marina]TQV70890.1 nucleotide exchange factor GrpE [Aliikangiella marina]
MSNNEELQNTEDQVSGDTQEQAEQSAAAEQELSFEEQTEKLAAELEQALQEAENHKDVAIRAKAESENIRRRAEREITNASKFALERFAREILAVVDSLEKALELPVEHDAQKSMREGIELTYKLLVDTLNKFNIEQIAPLGDAFDPGLHEAMVMQESDEHEPNSVMHVIQMGYSLNGRLIRPARVIVAKGKSPQIDEKA